MQVPVVLPDLGVAPAALSVWFADVGERVYEGDRLVEVLVQGATFDVAAPATGCLTEQQARPYQRLEPGQVLGVIEAEEAAEQG